MLLSSFFLDNKIETGLFSFHLQETIIPNVKENYFVFLRKFAKNVEILDFLAKTIFSFQFMLIYSLPKGWNWSYL